jgi:hypothetical protein
LTQPQRWNWWRKNFVSGFFKAKNKFFFLLLIILFDGTFTSFFEDKKSYGSHKKQYKSRFISLIWLDNGKIRIQEAQKLTDPADPDPQQ